MGTDSVNTTREGASPHQRRQLALDRANHIRLARAALKRRLRAGELAPADTILRGSSDTDTMTVAALLRSQRGWGPKRASKVLRSVSLSERKTLGSLTERQRASLVGVLSSHEPSRNSALAAACRQVAHSTTRS
jgi:hypothetical protein